MNPTKGICVDCPDDGKERWFGNKSKRLCVFHNKKRKVQQKKEKNIEKGEEETLKEFYERLWESRPHVSFLTGEKLLEKGHPFWLNQFCHILPKGKAMYPKFKFYEKNLVFLTHYQHLLLDSSSEEDRALYKERKALEGIDCDWNKIYSLQEELKSQYPNIL